MANAQNPTKLTATEVNPEQTAGRAQLGEFAPKFAELNDDVLFGEVWSRTDKLSRRDRSIVTVTSLVSSGIIDQSLGFHLQEAKKNGVTKTEICEVLTQVAFYAGWPKAWGAFRQAVEVWKESPDASDAKEKFEQESIFPIGEPNVAYAEYFTGNSYLAPLSTEQVNFSNVTFEPRCRNNWHIHHATKGGGQLLVGVAGRGWYQEDGKPAVEILPGTVVHIPANVKHWHGAADDSWFSHLAFSVPGEDVSNEWLEPVTDEEYDKLNNRDDMEHPALTTGWDKTFPQSGNVEHCKVTFHNRYGITLAADLYKPKGAEGKLAAIACSGPYGAVKEQVSGLYAQTLAGRGFLTIAFDPSFTGESGGTPRHLTSPEISTDDFSAAVDYLLTRDDVDYDNIGILGICGWGGFALNAAANDPRIKATVASTMYNMSEVRANGYFNAADDADSRYKLRQQLNEVRTNDYRNGEVSFTGSISGDFTPETPKFVCRYFDYYKNPERGYHHRSPNSTTGMTATSALAYINMPVNTYIDEIRNAVLLVHGAEAHSRYFSEEAFQRLKGDNKELYIVPGADHTDLYDNLNFIPFGKIESFYRKAFGK